MSRYKLSPYAVNDLGEIADFTIYKFGIKQAKIYRNGFINCFESLAINPGLGKKYNTKQNNTLFSFSYKAHTIFYTKEDDTVRIIRVLNNRMDFGRHL